MHVTRKTIHHLHAIRVVLFGALLISLLLIKVQPTTFGLAHQQIGNVLAYATNMSRGDLLAATNSYRQQNGLAALSLNDQLNNSSQNKAQHMIDNNYWAHVAPDGTQPWYFFEQAGYSYSAAGENLAYGFSTSYSVVDAWMNSAGHRANILGSYRDVGFGFVNGPSYQGGQNTVVVAHYGTSRNAAPTQPAQPATPTAPTAPSQQTPTQTTPSAPTQTPTTNNETSAEPDPTETPPAQEQEKSEETTPAEPAMQNTTVSSPQQSSVGFLQMLRTNALPITAVVGSFIAIVSMIGYVLTHRALVMHAVHSGESFALHHPMIDTAVVAAVGLLIVTTTFAQIG